MANNKSASQNRDRAPCARRALLAASLLIFLGPVVKAIPLNEYHAHVRQAVTALDTLAHSDETESAWDYGTRSAETINGVRNLLPPSEKVEWNVTNFSVDNSWLHQELDQFSSAPYSERLERLGRITERLQAVADRLKEIENPALVNLHNKAEERRKLAEILHRPEFARQVKGESAISRLLDRFLKWFQDLFPKPKPLSPGGAGLFSKIAQVLVFVLALAVLGFVLKLFLPRLLRSRRPRKKSKAEARIVLGEKLEPDRSATDLLSEAEMLARQGELRAAIRKAYIALLVELGDRKLISLAQYKTNRDYLRAVRGVPPLYGNVKQLTDSFERHWYGFAQATETDWLAFRDAYDQTLR
jgi:hypothetical protein